MAKTLRRTLDRTKWRSYNDDPFYILSPDRRRLDVYLLSKLVFSHGVVELWQPRLCQLKVFIRFQMVTCITVFQKVAVE